MNPKVSIVSTVYDRVDCLRRCLRAMQHSTWTDWEQIVVSDAPPADVVAQIAALVAEAGPRVRYLNLPARTENYGHDPAQAGLRLAIGEYVCFLSDDNAYLPGHFEPLVAALDADPALGFAYSSCLYAAVRRLRAAKPAGAQIDLGQPLFRRAIFREQFDDVIPGRGAFAWDWETIHAWMKKGLTWQHIDQLSFVFRLAAYPGLVKELA
jgi:glycosyltransferase involved in cell wall biosynthesis